MNAGIAMDLLPPTTCQEYPLRVDSDHSQWPDIVHLNVRLFDESAKDNSCLMKFEIPGPNLSSVDKADVRVVQCKKAS